MQWYKLLYLWSFGYHRALPQKVTALTAHTDPDFGCGLQNPSACLGGWDGWVAGASVLGGKKAHSGCSQQICVKFILQILPFLFEC